MVDHDRPVARLRRVPDQDRPADPGRRPGAPGSAKYAGRLHGLAECRCSCNHAGVVSTTTTTLPAAATGALDDRELRAWRGLLRVHATLSKALDNQLDREHDLPLTSYEVLQYLADAEEQKMRMCDLASSVILSRIGPDAARRPPRARRPARPRVLRLRRARRVREADARRLREAQRGPRDPPRQRPGAVPRQAHARGAGRPRRRLGARAARRRRRRRRATTAAAEPARRRPHRARSPL